MQDAAGPHAVQVVQDQRERDAIQGARDAGLAAGEVRMGRMHYGGGGDWYGNPTSLPNLARALKERTSFSISPSMRRETGIPVHRDTTSATSSSSTSSLSILPFAWSAASSARPNLRRRAGW